MAQGSPRTAPEGPKTAQKDPTKTPQESLERLDLLISLGFSVYFYLCTVTTTKHQGSAWTVASAFGPHSGTVTDVASTPRFRPHHGPVTDTVSTPRFPGAPGEGSHKFRRVGGVETFDAEASKSFQ